MATSTAHRSFKPNNLGGWKDLLKRSCLQRARQHRSDFLHENRQNLTKAALSTIIRNECAQLNPRGTDNPLILSAAEHEDLLLYLQNEILEEEKLQEEQLLQKQLEEHLRYEEEAIRSSFASAIVVCPICQKNQLLQNGAVIFCRCGIRLDTKHDGITLAMVAERIAQILHIHR
jgi:hypothetical protein